MRFATFNVYWLGTTRTRIVQREAADEALLARVLATLDVDVIALQEVCDLGLLDRLLARAHALGGRRFVSRAAGVDVCSGRVSELGDGAAQKVAFAWDADRVEPIRWGALEGGPSLRRPLVARFRDRADGAAFTGVALHLKSGRLGAPLSDPSVALRAAETAWLGRWLCGEPVGGETLRELSRSGLVLLGDLNARQEDPSLAAILTLPGWDWQIAEAPPGERWTTFLDRAVIDHIAVGPGARLAAPPVIRMWDRDPAVFPVGDPDWFHRVEAFEAQRGREYTREPVENLYRVSDHRAVVAEVQPA